MTNRTISWQFICTVVWTMAILVSLVTYETLGLNPGTQNDAENSLADLCEADERGEDDAILAETCDTQTQQRASSLSAFSLAQPSWCSTPPVPPPEL